MAMNLIEMVKEELRVFDYHTFRHEGIFEEEVIEIMRGNKPNDDSLIKCLAKLFGTSPKEMRNIIDKTPWNPPSTFWTDTLAIFDEAIRVALILAEMQHQ
jgi:hypothetical protein